MAINPIDELNILSAGVKSQRLTQRGVPFTEYFGTLPISSDRKERRIELAKDLLEVMMFYYALIEQRPTRTLAKTQLYNEILDQVIKYGRVDKYVDDLCFDLARDINNTTFKHLPKGDLAEDLLNSYYTSTDRALFCAEDMSHSFINYFEYAENKGKTKIWNTQEDNKVRQTHAEVDNISLPYDGIFKVGDSQMRFPKDVSLGASAEETINCRCFLTFV